jgi:hypothetical protein
MPEQGPLVLLDHTSFHVLEIALPVPTLHFRVGDQAMIQLYLTHPGNVLLEQRCSNVQFSYCFFRTP